MIIAREVDWRGKKCGRGGTILRVLLVLDHAPDYRETFLRELGRHVELTVVAQSCDVAGLAPPDKRHGYEYVELPAFRLAGFVWQSGLHRVLTGSQWDVICVGLNMRHLNRLCTFRQLPHLRTKWIWWGHVFGRNQSAIIERVRKGLLQRGVGCLTYNEPTAQLAKQRYAVEAISFNNSEVSIDEFRPGQFGTHSELRFLFVGRFQPRKRLERLVQMALTYPDVWIRLIGPGMDQLAVPKKLLSGGRIQRFSRMRGEELNPHFDWADLVVNPGHVGLLVMNAARHGKGIAIDADSQHAPESWLAKEAGQPFVRFADVSAVDAFVEDLRRHRERFREWGQSLQQVARSRYTVEYMVRMHLDMFRKVETSYGREYKD